jgi:HK97 family phage major capsid protein
VVEVAAPNNREGLSLNGGGNAALEARNKETAEISQFCHEQGCSARAAGFIREGLSLSQVGLEILKSKTADGTLKGVNAEIKDGLNGKDRKRWSMNRALDQLCLRVAHGRAIDGVEGEVHQFLERRAREAKIDTQGGMWMPTSLTDPIERHTLVSNVAGKGAEFIFDQPGELIELLRNDSVCLRMGARMLSDLTGPIPFPKQTGDVTVQFVGENPASPVGVTDATTGVVTLQPKSMQGAAQISRQQLRQSSIDTEKMTRESFAFGHSLAFDRGGLHGRGAAGEVTGIYVAPDVGSVACGGVAPTWQKCLDMISAVAVANAHRGALGFVTTPQLAAKLKNVLKVSAVATGFIWNGRLDEGDIDGYRAISSNQVSAVLGAGLNEHGFIFGNWAEMIMGLWGGVEVIADPYTAAGSGLVKFTSFQMGDLILRHGQSFTKATAATLS